MKCLFYLLFYVNIGVKTTVKKGIKVDKHSDVLIIGSGIAALQAAKTLGEHLQVCILTKSTITTSSSYRAQGGIAAVTSQNDQFQLHIDDTLEAGVYHHDRQQVASLVHQGANAVHQLIKDGFNVDKTKFGEISLGLEGAHSRNRIIHAGGDQTGKSLIDYLLKQLPRNVSIYPFRMAFELIKNTDNECIGVKVLHDGHIENYYAHHIVLATGGSAALYPFTSNYSTNIGDGMAIAYLAGAAITDMEFMQFHPTLLYMNGETKGLISEAVRGAGAQLVGENGNRIMEGVHPLLDLAPRHITAFEIYKHRAQGKNVYLDISMIKNFNEKFPTITKLCQEHGISLQQGLIPVAPGSHFTMGGVIADHYGRTTIPNLYAIGEVACTGVHGANRLASNSLLEGIAFGQNMANWIRQQGCSQTNFKVQSISTNPKHIQLLSKEALQQHLFENIGIIRNERGMLHLLSKLPTLNDLQQLSFDSLTKQEIELIFMHIIAVLMTTAAIMRKESRGAHIRADYPQTNIDWQEKWIVFQQGQLEVRNSLYEQHQVRRNAEAIF